MRHSISGTMSTPTSAADLRNTADKYGSFQEVSLDHDDWHTVANAIVGWTIRIHFDLVNQWRIGMITKFTSKLFLYHIVFTDSSEADLMLSKHRVITIQA